LILIVQPEHVDSSISNICKRVIEEKKEFYDDEGRKTAAAQRKKMTFDEERLAKDRDMTMFTSHVKWKPSWAARAAPVRHSVVRHGPNRVYPALFPPPPLVAAAQPAYRLPLRWSEATRRRSDVVFQKRGVKHALGLFGRRA
jgi:hypothetical protein